MLSLLRWTFFRLLSPLSVHFFLYVHFFADKREKNPAICHTSALVEDITEPSLCFTLRIAFETLDILN